MNKTSFAVTLTSDQERLLAYAGGLMGSILANPSMLDDSMRLHDSEFNKRIRGIAIEQAKLLISEVQNAPNLLDPKIVHANMLHGTIGKISMEMCAHLQGAEMTSLWNDFLDYKKALKNAT